MKPANCFARTKGDISGTVHLSPKESEAVLWTAVFVCTVLNIPPYLLITAASHIGHPLQMVPLSVSVKHC